MPVLIKLVVLESGISGCLEVIKAFLEVQ